MADNKTPRNLKFYLLLAVVAVLTIYALIVTYQFSQKTYRYSLIITSLQNIKIETTTGHLWFEELITGDQSHEIKKIYDHIDKAIVSAEKMIECCKHLAGTNQEIINHDLQGKMTLVLSSLLTLKDLTAERYKFASGSGIGSQIDQEYDDTYYSLMTHVDSIETILKHSSQEDLKVGSNIHWILMTIVVLLLGIILFVQLAHESQHKKNFAEISRQKELAVNSEAILRENQAEREKLLESLRTKTAEMERFIYTVSHDLKGPLLTISGFLSILEQEVESGNKDKIKESFSHISKASERMKMLIDELLEICRLGVKPNDLQIINARELIDEAILSVSGLINEFQAEIIVQDSLPEMHVDRQKFLHVFENLITNAVRYSKNSPEGAKVKIGADAKEDETVYYVEDNGIGIHPDYIEKVFDLFERIDPTNDGTGVGLAIVKKIVETHGGRIWAESDGMNKGTIFYFALPNG